MSSSARVAFLSLVREGEREIWTVRERERVKGREKKRPGIYFANDCVEKNSSTAA